MPAQLRNFELSGTVLVASTDQTREGATEATRIGRRRIRPRSRLLRPWQHWVGQLDIEGKVVPERVCA